MANSVIRLSNIPFTANAKELVEFLESRIDKGSVWACNVVTEHYNWKSKGVGYVQFETEDQAARALASAENNDLIFDGHRLRADRSLRLILPPPKQIVRVENVDLLLGNLKSQECFHQLWRPSGNVVLEVDCQTSDVSILLREPVSDSEYKMEFKSGDILSVCETVIAKEDSSAVLLKVYNPPHIYMRISELKRNDRMLQLMSSLLEKAGECLNGFTGYPDNYRYYKVDPGQWTRTKDFTPFKSIGQSLVYCLGFHSEDSAEYRKTLDALTNFHRESGRLVSNRLLVEEASHYASMQVVVPILKVPSFGFSTRLIFTVNHLVQWGNLNPSGLTDRFYNSLSTLKPDLAVSLLQNLSRFQSTCFDPLTTIQEMISSHECSPPITLGDGYMLVNRILVTPSKVYCMQPEVDLSNRVTRNYANMHDNFVRVSFVDEDLKRVQPTVLSLPTPGSIGASVEDMVSDVYRHFLNVLRTGIQVGDKHFEFLAFSNSQLREHSCWMFAKSGETTAESIRAWMGDFQNIKNVAKCAARMGQSFSSSMHSLDVFSNEVSCIKDIIKIVGDQEYIFSDGIGKISKAFAMQVAEKCGITKHVPSAFQIRYGGYKGVVAVDPTSFAKLSLRDSMRKFTSDRTSLDVLFWSRYIPCYLNRQVIMLLSTLGIEDYVFEKMQKEAVEHLDNLLEDPLLAMEILQAGCSGDTHRIIVEMIQAGYNARSEPYLNSLLQAFKAYQLLMLRTKSRILVPKGRCLLGCLDETGTLNYGEVFIQVSPTPGSCHILDDGLGKPQSKRGVTKRDTATVVEGKVIVAKNPCLHPGDILILKAVDVPALSHMVDCIVFPQKGDRPHPNECSGSDLDGDIYFVSWDADLIPKAGYVPMNYSATPAVVLDHSVTSEEIQEFFVNHMLNDGLGQIANAHLVHADKEVNKAINENCILLAELFSVAVDFPKTGTPASIPINLRPFIYPDFMEKEDKLSYPSNTVIGKLFRAIKEVEGRLSVMTVDMVYDNDMRVDGFESYIDEALKLKSHYDTKLTTIMEQYGIENEAETMSGFILKLSKHHNKHYNDRVGKRSEDTKERILFALQQLQIQVKSWFYGDGSQSAAEQNAKASAWYTVTYDPDYWNSQHVRLLSFPWTISKKLLEIKCTRASANNFDAKHAA